MSTLDRRALLAAILSAAVVPCVRGRTSGSLRGPIEPGVQLFSVGPKLGGDLIGTLVELERIGYNFVELAGLMNYPESAWADALKQSELECHSVHFGFQRVGKDPGLEVDFDRIAAFCRNIGASYIVVPTPWMPERLNAVLTPATRTRATFAAALAQLTVPEWNRTSELLNEYGARLAKQGLHISYHNHNSEFARIGDSTYWERMVNQTDAGYVNFELDIGWAASAGRDPMALMERYRERIKQIHIRDLAAINRPNLALEMAAVPVGTGVLDLKHLLICARNIGVEQFYIEEDYNNDQIFSVLRNSLAVVRGLAS